MGDVYRLNVGRDYTYDNTQFMLLLQMLSVNLVKEMICENGAKEMHHEKCLQKNHILSEH